MTKADRRKDKKILSQPDDYVDPARYRGLKRKKRSKASAKRQAGSKDVALYSPQARPQIPPHERFGIMQVALQLSVEEAAELCEVAPDTIYRWFREEGGIQEVKRYVSGKASLSFYRTLELFIDDLPGRLATLSNKEYFETFRKLLATAQEAGLTSESALSRSGSSPPPTQQPSIVLQYSNPPGSSQEGNGKQGQAAPPPEEDADVVEGEFVDVFDE